VIELPDYPFTVEVELGSVGIGLRPASESFYVRICRGARDCIIVGGLTRNEAEIRAGLLRDLLA
jgi:hypothetical protein